jgi:uncharacterized protein YaeQ
MRIHRAGEIEAVVPDPELVARLAATLDRNNRWHVTVSDGELIVDTGRGTFTGPIHRFRPLESDA